MYLLSVRKKKLKNDNWGPWPYKEWAPNERRAPYTVYMRRERHVKRLRTTWPLTNGIQVSSNTPSGRKEICALYRQLSHTARRGLWGQGTTWNRTKEYFHPLASDSEMTKRIRFIKVSLPEAKLYSTELMDSKKKSPTLHNQIRGLERAN